MLHSFLSKGLEGGMNNRGGHLVRQQGGVDGYSAFIPALPPPDPPVDLTGEMAPLNRKARTVNV